MAFNVGDVVQLKSGGPKMTISRPDESNPRSFWCVWFDDEQSTQAACFNDVVLKKSAGK